MTSPHFGIEILKQNNEARPALVADMSIVGIAGVAPAANALKFPYNVPVFRYSNDQDLVADLGLSGTLLDAIDGINDQLGVAQVAAKVIIVRVEQGSDNDETMTNLIGDSTSRTGIHAFRRAGADLGHVPRLICVPGFTAAQKTGVIRLTLTNAGSSYENQPAVGFSGGTPDNAATAKAVLTPTAVNTVTVTEDGSGYTQLGIELTVTGGGDHPNKVMPTFEAIVTAGAVASVSVIASGDNITEDVLIAISEEGHGGLQATATVQLVSSTIQSLVILTPGDGYDLAPTVSITGGGGTGGAATSTIAPVANAVVAELPAVLNAIRAHAVVDANADSQIGYTNWREAHSSDRLIPIATTVKVGQGLTVRPASPRIIGAIVRTDFEHGGVPSHSAANTPIQGIVAPGRFIEFSIEDGATEGQTIMEQNGGIIVRGEVGVESAIANAGFIYLGTDTLSEDTLWKFYNVNRMRDFVHLIYLRTLRYYLGRFNITGQTVEAIRMTMVNALTSLQAQDHILGFRVRFLADQNSPDDIRLGHLTIEAAFEEPPPLTKITIRSLRYRPALEALIANIVNQLEIAQQ